VVSTSVLIPLDGWPKAEEALPVANRLAQAKHAGLLLIRSIADRPGSPEHSEAEDYLRRVAGRFVDGFGPVETAVLHGDPAKTIVARASEPQVALIVTATHGRSGVGRWIYGSVADNVLRHAPVPVVLVPSPTGAISPWTTAKPLRILVPLDGSDRSASVIDPMRGIATEVGASIVLLQVIDRPPQYAVIPTGAMPVIERDPDADPNRARQYLERVAERLRPTIHTVDVRCEPGSPAARIAHVAAEEKIDLIVMATHGRGGLTRFALGSVATGTVQRAGLPVLLVPPLRVESVTAHESGGIQVPPAPASAGPVVSVSLTPSEVGLARRGLQNLYYKESTTPELARAIQTLRGRLGQETQG
jgi:nucleotide-binding universal stress UspA family protein